MTKAEAIEVLIANYPASYYESLREAVDEAIEALEQPEHQWVPSSERLPEKAGAYLVTTNRNNVYLWWYRADNIIDWQRLVKAWLPLPEPYKENKDD